MNLLNEGNNSKFVIINGNLSMINQTGIIVQETKSYTAQNLSDYNDAYILVRGNTIIIGRNLATKVAFKNCFPFIKSIRKIDETTKDGAEDLDLVILMYNLLEYS